jgi:hypothetical protein
MKRWSVGLLGGAPLILLPILPNALARTQPSPPIMQGLCFQQYLRDKLDPNQARRIDGRPATIRGVHVEVPEHGI